MPQYKEGTIDVTNGSNAVSGTDTKWTSEISAGDWLVALSKGIAYQIATVLSDTSLELTTNYGQETETGISYAVIRDFTSPDNIPLMSIGDVDTPVIFSRAMNRIQSVFNEWVNSQLALKNVIINGNFDIWQRGTVFNDPNGAYGPDRWAMFRNGTNTVTFSRQAFTLGQTDVPGEPQYYLQWEKTAGVDGPPELRQRIESVRTFAGETVSVSFWAKADSARNLDITFNQRFGTGGTPSGVVTTAVATVSLTTSWQRFTATITLPGISGKTLGTDGNDSLEFRLDWADASNGTVDLARVQVERGDRATDFERRPIGVELDLCARYFRLVSVASGVAISSTNAQFTVPHAGMRTGPSPAASGTLQITDYHTANYTQSGANLSLNENNSDGGRYEAANFTGLTQGDPIGLVTSGSRIQLDAEL